MNDQITASRGIVRKTLNDFGQYIPLFAVLCVASITNTMTNEVLDLYPLGILLYYLPTRLWGKHARPVRSLAGLAFAIVVSWGVGFVLFSEMRTGSTIGFGTAKLLCAIGLAIGLRATIVMLFMFFVLVAFLLFIGRFLAAPCDVPLTLLLSVSTMTGVLLCIRKETQTTEMRERSFLRDSSCKTDATLVSEEVGVANNTSEGIRQPADGSPKPST